MAVPIGTISFRDVVDEIWSPSEPLNGKTLLGLHSAATGTFDPTYAEAGTTLSEFQNYQHTAPPYLTISPSSDTVSSSSGSVTFSVSSNVTWSITNGCSSWITFSPSSGTGDATITVTYNANTGPERDCVSDVTTTDGSNITRKYTLTQSAGLYGYNFSYGTTSGEACSGTYPGSTTYYVDGQGLDVATMIYSDSAGTTFAADGWYSDGFNRREATNGVLGTNFACR